MRSEPHSDSSSRHYSKSEIKYKKKKDISSYEATSEVSSCATVYTAVTWKAAYSSSDEDHTVTFELDLPKMHFQERNFQLNRKPTKKSIVLETPTEDPSK